MRTVTAALALLFAFSSLAAAAEIKVIGSPGFREAYSDLIPAFEKATGNKVRTTWGGVNEIAKRVAGGESADIVILPVAQIDELIRQGKLVADSKVDVAKSGIGVAVRSGLPRIDTSSGEAVKKAMLSAKSIAYSTGPSGIHIGELIEAWGIAEQVKRKIVISPPDTPVGVMLARGQADLGFQQVSELIRVKGIDYLGPLPTDVQEVTVFAAVLHKAATSPDAAKALLKFLGSPAAAPVIRKTGMEPG